VKQTRNEEDSNSRKKIAAIWLHSISQISFDRPQNEELRKTNSKFGQKLSFDDNT
jgi:hypothetical protein